MFHVFTRRASSHDGVSPTLNQSDVAHLFAPRLEGHQTYLEREFMHVPSSYLCTELQQKC